VSLINQTAAGRRIKVNNNSPVSLILHTKSKMLSNLISIGISPAFSNRNHQQEKRWLQV